jgi:hypothetical protein
VSAIDRALLVGLGLSPQLSALVMTEIETLRIELAECQKARSALLSMVKMCYRKHVLGDDNIGWTQLEDYLLHALCNDMGDDGYQKWVEAAKENL